MKKTREKREREERRKKNGTGSRGKVERVKGKQNEVKNGDRGGGGVSSRAYAHVFTRNISKAGLRRGL